MVSVVMKPTKAMEGKMMMSSTSKIEEIITDLVTPLANQIRSLEKQSIAKEHIDDLLQDNYAKIISRFKTLNIHELKSLEDKYRKQEVHILNKFFKLQNEGKSIPEADLLQRGIFEVVTRSIDQAINEKREYNRQFSRSHIFERTLIQAGAITANSPQKTTLEKMKKLNDKKELALQIERQTIRKNVFQNLLGNTLQSYDGKVLLGLFKLWLSNPDRPKNIRFQFSELAHAMNSKPSGGEYKLIYDSLNNLLQTTLYLKAYLDPTSGFYSAEVMYNPVDNIVWYARSQEEDKTGKQREAIVTFGDVIYQNLASGNYVFLSGVIYNELPTSYARLIYLFLLDQLSEDQQSRSLDMDVLIEQLSISGEEEIAEEANNRSRITRQIEAGLDRLKEQDIISEYTVRKQGNRKKWIDFTPSEWIISHNIKQLV